MWNLQLKLLASKANQAVLQVYCPLRRARETLPGDRWLVLAIVPPAAALLFALFLCLFTRGAAAQFFAGASIALTIAAAAYALLAAYASFLGPSLTDVEHALARLQDQQKALRTQMAPPSLNSATQRSVRFCPSVPRDGPLLMQRPALVLPGQQLPRYVCFSPDGSLLASFATRAIELWDINGGVCKNTVVLPKASVVLAGAFSPDGSLLAAACSDGSVRLWDVCRGLCVRSLEGHEAPIHAVAFSRDGNRLASGSGAGTTKDDQYIDEHMIRLWDAPSGECLACLGGHKSTVTSLCFHPSGTMLASTGLHGEAKVWDLQTFGCIGGFHDDRHRLGLVSFNGKGQLLCLVEKWLGDKPPYEPADFVEFSNASQPFLAPLHTSQVSVPGRALCLGGQIANSAFSPDASLLAANTLELGKDNGGAWETWVWKTQSGSPVTRCFSIGLPLAFNKDGTLLATGLTIWSITQSQNA